MFSGYFLKAIFYKTNLLFINSHFELDSLEDKMSSLRQLVTSVYPRAMKKKIGGVNSKWR